MTECNKCHKQLLYSFCHCCLTWHDVFIMLNDLQNKVEELEQMHRYHDLEYE